MAEGLMTSRKLFLSRISLILVLLVVLAGSIVRATGSGMGCPDWPKCFGYFIPPSDPQTLVWSAAKTFEKGQMVIKDGGLWVSKKIHQAEIFSEQNWVKYEVHDYAEFNAAHTWIEYVNRLLGALSGLPILLLFVLSLWSVRKDLMGFVLATGVLFLLGFVAWLGKVVVDSNLTAGKITLHMAGAVAIVTLLVLIIRRNLENKRVDNSSNKALTTVLIVALVFSLIQIFLGTRVREGVDELMKMGIDRGQVAEYFGIDFLTHRTMAWLIILSNLIAWWLMRKKGGMGFIQNVPLLIVGLELISGIILVYVGMPAFMQPVHLVAAFLLFASLLFLATSRLSWLSSRT